jgi:malate dehydrogenase (oxaloacetate-decarboxylating)(NADP+)
MGMGNRVHIVTPSITARGLLNIAALATSSVLLNPLDAD